MRIIANHAHVFQESVRPHGTISVLKQVLDECGISQAVAFAPFPRHFKARLLQLYMITITRT